MTPAAAMLRLLLGLILILNGIGTAYSGARMQLQHTHTDESAGTIVRTADTHAAKSQCNEGMEATHPAAVAEEATPASDAAGPTCCDGATCDCACSQHGSALVLVSGTGSVDSKHVSALHPLVTGHAPPALPSPIRPPIG